MASELEVGKLTVSDGPQLERVSEYTAKLSCVDSGGNQTLQILGNRAAGSGSSGTDVLIGGEQSRTTGYVLKVEQGSDTYLTIDSTGKIGQNCDPEAFMHIQAADASVAPAGTADVAAFEFTAGAGIDGISLLYPDAKTGQIVFGTPADNDAGRIVYGGPSVTTAADQDAMRFHTAGAEAMRIDSTGLASFLNGVTVSGDVAYGDNARVYHGDLPSTGPSHSSHDKFNFNFTFSGTYGVALITLDIAAGLGEVAAGRYTLAVSCTANSGVTTQLMGSVTEVFKHNLTALTFADSGSSNRTFTLSVERTVTAENWGTNTGSYKLEVTNNHRTLTLNSVTAST